MTRISSAMIPSAALLDLQRAQSSLVEAARQSAAQTKATSLKGYGREAQTLVSAERLASRTEGFLATAREMKTRMQVQDVALGRAADMVSKLKQDLFQNVGLESGEGVRAQLEEAFSVLYDSMNTNIGGRYLFGGMKNDAPPISATTLNQLRVDPLTDSIEQGAAAQLMRIEENRTVSAGVVAGDFISDALASIKRLAEMDAGIDGPFGEDLTDVQKSALQLEIAALGDAFDNILAAQAENGRLLKDVDASSSRQQGQLDTLKGAIGEIVNVDLAEVAVRLNQAQYAYEASASVFNMMRGMSLLNFLSD